MQPVTSVQCLAFICLSTVSCGGAVASNGLAPVDADATNDMRVSETGSTEDSPATSDTESSDSGAVAMTGSVPADGSAKVGDASVQYDVSPPGLAGLAFVVNGVVQHQMRCPSDNWEFASPTTLQGMCVTPPLPPPYGCPGVSNATLINTGGAPVAYIAAAAWSGMGYVPGVATGEPGQLVGTLEPGEQVDITSVFDASGGGIVAIVGSADPFSSPDAGKYAGDEGTIPWPAGVAGSGGATEMRVAEVEVSRSCRNADVVW
jgi:hypothetical protein